MIYTRFTEDGLRQKLIGKSILDVKIIELSRGYIAYEFHLNNGIIIRVNRDSVPNLMIEEPS